MKTTANNSSKYLLLFFVITFVWTWGFGFAPLALGLVGTPIGTFLFYFGGWCAICDGTVYYLFDIFQRRKKGLFQKMF